MRNPKHVFTAGLTAALIVIMVAPPAAQTTAPPPLARTTNAVIARPERVELLVGRSTVIRTERPIKRVSLPKPEVADAMVTSPNEVLVHGKLPGTISLFIWGDNGDIVSYDVSVRRDLSELEQRVRQLFPGEPIQVSSNGADVVLSGIVSSKYIVDKATSLATGYVEKADNVVNLLRQQEGVASNQILLRVRFAEVSRSAMQELGVSFFTSPTGVKNTIGRVTTQQFAAPGYDKLQYTKDSSDWGAPVTSASGEFTFSDFLNLFLFSEKYDIGAMVKALSSKGLFQSLAEPNLVTQNGKEASFLAGGEYPYPVVQGGNSNAVSVEFKEFGIRLKFTPTVIGGDLINLKIAPEVSSLDFGNAVTFSGFRVPALTSRRTQTEVELRDGQTFAIAGLIDNSLTSTMSKVPGIGDIPVLGYLFRSKAYQKNTTELVVMITPQILRRDSTGVTPNLPQLVEPFLPPEQKMVPPPPPAFTGRPQAAAPAPGAPMAAGSGVPSPAVPPAVGAVAVAPVAQAPKSAVAPQPAPVAPAQAQAAQAQAAQAQPASVQPAPAMMPPAFAQHAVAPAAAKPDKKAEERARREEEQRAREEEKRAREAAEQAAKRDAEELKQREADAKRQEREQKKLAEQQKKEQAVQEKLQAEQQKKQAEEDKKRTEEMRKQLERDKKALEQHQKPEVEAATHVAQPEAVVPEALRVKNLEEQRADAERKKTEERKKSQQKAAKRRALSDPYPPLRSRRSW
jgi:pilus assembly protein CpaC